MKKTIAIILALASLLMIVTSGAIATNHNVELGKDISKETTDDNDFNYPHTANELIVVITEEASGYNKTFEASDFPGVNIEEIEYITFLFDDPADYPMLNVEHYHQILLLKINEANDEKLSKAVESLKMNEIVEEVTLNYICEVESSDQGKESVPNRSYPYPVNDPYFWYQDPNAEEINLADAWKYSKGSIDVKIGIACFGINNHNDLTANLTSGTNVDSGTSTSDIADGTCVAGVVGARGNNSIGISGICQKVTMVPIRLSNATNTVTTAKMKQAVVYASENSIPILLISEVIYTTLANKNTLNTAIAQYNGLVVCPAGDNTRDIDDHYAYTTYCIPGTCSANNIICVAAWDYENNCILATSNYGVTSVDLVAPGEYIYTTSNTSNSGYKFVEGSKYAAAYVAGTAGLILSYDRSLNASYIKSAIMNTVHTVTVLNGKVKSGGQLDAGGALNNAATLISSKVKNYRSIVKLTNTHPIFTDVFISTDIDNSNLTYRKYTNGKNALTGTGNAYGSSGCLFYSYGSNNSSQYIPASFHGELFSIWFDAKHDVNMNAAVEYDETTSDYAGVNVSSMSYTPSYVNVLMGDVNMDGIVDSDDVELISSYIVGGTTLTEIQKFAANVNNDVNSNNDQKINSLDVNRLMSYIAGNITCLVNYSTLSRLWRQKSADIHF